MLAHTFSNASAENAWSSTRSHFFLSLKNSASKGDSIGGAKLNANDTYRCVSRACSRTMADSGFRFLVSRIGLAYCNLEGAGFELVSAGGMMARETPM